MAWLMCLLHGYKWLVIGCAGVGVVVGATQCVKNDSRLREQHRLVGGYPPASVFETICIGAVGGVVGGVGGGVVCGVAGALLPAAVLLFAGMVVAGCLGWGR